MTKKKKQQAKSDETIENFLKTVIKGIKDMGQSIVKLLLFVISVIMVTYMARNQTFLMEKWNPDGMIAKSILFYALWLLPILLLVIYGSMEKKPDRSYQDQFESIKFCNKKGQYPELIERKADGKKEILSFKSAGIPITEWRDKRIQLEAAMDCNILKINVDAKTKTVIILETVPAEVAMGTNIRWKHEYMSTNKDDFEIVAGEGLLDKVTFDFDKHPHALLAGVTGSGKSVLLRLFLWQFIYKGATPYMIDFKGGIELTDFEEFGEVVFDRNKALDLLKEINKELALRLDLFRDCGVKKLPEYNRKFPDKELTRIVIACDEVAEMLDKTGLSSSDAAIYKEIEKELSTIARLGRAPGIHMLLGTQRPDAKVIVGQIKNNLPIRISGRMTDVQASEMVLGNSKAVTISDTKGRFMYTVGSDTFEFQAYNFQDSDIIPGNYRRGTMLIDEDGKSHIQDEGGNSGEQNQAFDAEEITVNETTKRIKRRGLSYERVDLNE